MESAVHPIEEIYPEGNSRLVECAYDLQFIEESMARDFNDSPAVIKETRKAIQYFFNLDAEYLGYGHTRIVFVDNEGRVIKIPFTREGYQASSDEVRTYENFKKNPDAGWIPTAECFFTQLEGINIWLLSMERVTRFKRAGKDLPRWVDSVDCGQVGYNSAGELVAYDL